MSLEIVHAADYQFPRPAADLQLVVRMAPAAWEVARVRAFALSVVPPPAASADVRDRWGNSVRLVRFDRPLARLGISAHITVCGDRIAPTGRAPGAADLLLRSGGMDGDRPPDERDTATVVVAAECGRLRDGWRFEPHPEAERASLASLWRDRCGQCLELSRLLVWRLRARGLPARLVLGYSLAPQRKRVLRQRHAWVAFHDGAGWREIDPSEPDRSPEALFATAWGPSAGLLMPVRARRRADLSGVRGSWSTQVTGVVPAKPPAAPTTAGRGEQPSVAPATLRTNPLRSGGS